MKLLNCAITLWTPISAYISTDTHAPGCKPQNWGRWCERWGQLESPNQVTVAAFMGSTLPASVMLILLFLVNVGETPTAPMFSLRHRPGPNKVTSTQMPQLPPLETPTLQC
jgi:hypothetical protein